MLLNAKNAISCANLRSKVAAPRLQKPTSRHIQSKSDAIWQEFRSTHRPTWAEIDLDNVAHNVKSLRTKLPKKSTLIAVVKADGYGHGADFVATAALEAGAQRLAVAAVEEGILLRRNGVVSKDVDIIILGLSAPGTEEALLKNNLIPTVADVDSLSRFVVAHQRLGLPKPLRYHLKVDTGMGRIGALPDSIPDFIDTIKKSDLITRNSIMEGVYTHFSKADEVEKDHTKDQVAKFHKVVKTLKAQGINPPLVHSANSAGIIDSSLIYSPHDLESGIITAWRVGVSLYGFYPSEDVDKSGVPELRPAMTWKTQIVQTKNLGPGHTISYGGEYVTGKHSKETIIATLPLGYADGFRRRLGRDKPPHKPAFHVLVHGKKAPIVGRVCMDMIHIDVTHIPGATAGDEVVLIGKQLKSKITAEQMAKKLKTINYEISCLVGKRVPRLYKKNGDFIALKSIICDTTKDSL